MPGRAVLLIWLVLTSFALSEPRYRFTVDGKSWRAKVISLEGRPDEPAAGDLAYVSGWWITLDEPGEYAFQRRDDFGGSLWRVLPQGVELVAAEFTMSDHLRGGPHFSGAFPSQLSRAQRASLRGIKVNGWHARFVRELALLDLGRVCVEHSFSGANDYRKHPFPKKTTRLIGLPSASVRLPELLVIYGGVPQDFDELRSLVHSPKLRAASLLFNATEESPLFREALLAWPQLRSLDVAFVDHCMTSDVMGNHPQLRYLQVSAGDFGDSMAHWTGPALETLILDRVSASALPKTLPKLRVAALTPEERFEPGAEDTPPSDEERSQFRKSHPHADLALDWHEYFAREIRGCDRLRVRAGGECCIPENADEFAYDTSDPREVAALLSMVRVHPWAGESGIMDCGNRTIEFYRGNQLLRRLGMWAFPGLRQPSFRLALTEMSSDLVGQWMICRHRGSTGGFEPREQRFGRYREIMPEHLLPNVRVSGPAAEAVVASWPLALDSRSALVSRAFALYGCHEDNWNVVAGLDEALRKRVLADFDIREILELATNTETSDAERTGAARWLFGDGHHADLPDEDFERILSGLGREALMHPRVINRRMTIAALARRNTSGARALLMEVVSQRLLVPEKPERPPHENASGMAEPFVEWPTVPDHWPDAVAAAIHLLAADTGASAERLAQLKSQASEEVWAKVEAYRAFTGSARP
jgi:hypothetical protein